MYKNFLLFNVWKACRLLQVENSCIDLVQSLQVDNSSIIFKTDAHPTAAQKMKRTLVQNYNWLEEKEGGKNVTESQIYRGETKHWEQILAAGWFVQLEVMGSTGHSVR